MRIPLEVGKCRRQEVGDDGNVVLPWNKVYEGHTIQFSRPQGNREHILSRQNTMHVERIHSLWPAIRLTRVTQFSRPCGNSSNWLPEMSSVRMGRSKSSRGSDVNWLNAIMTFQSLGRVQMDLGLVQKKIKCWTGQGPRPNMCIAACILPLHSKYTRRLTSWEFVQRREKILRRL
jgi:hypothetical protein